MSKGYVYVLTNPSMPGMVKIGKTTRDSEGRALELYQTGVPTPFVVHASLYAPDCHELERKAHEHFEFNRVSPGREFFKCGADEAQDVLADLLREQIEELVSEFVDGLKVCEEWEFLDIADMEDAIRASGAHPVEVTTALLSISGDELKAIVQRHRARRQSPVVVLQ